MGIGEILAIAFAGLAAGTINTVVGSGTLITFPVLLGFGYAPVTANVSNTIGLVPGSVSGAVGYRSELAASAAARCASVPARCSAASPARCCSSSCRPRPSRRSSPSLSRSPSSWSCCSRGSSSWLARRAGGLRGHEHSLFTPLAVYATGVYGGYFGAAQGVLLLGILGVALPQSLHRTNALKNILAGLANGIAGIFFVLFAHVAWAPAALIAAGSIVGGQLGATYGRRLSPDILRALIVVIGTTAIVRLLTG